MTGWPLTGITFEGEPGHFCGCRGCCFFIHNVIAERWRISSVGCYHGGTVEPLDRTEDNIVTLDSSDHIYETMVFDLEQDSLTEIEALGYFNREAAEAGHAGLVAKYWNMENGS